MLLVLINCYIAPNMIYFRFINNDNIYKTISKPILTRFIIIKASTT